MQTYAATCNGKNSESIELETERRFSLKLSDKKDKKKIKLINNQTNNYWLTRIEIIFDLYFFFKYLFNFFYEKQQ